jgi:hypothetical protein
MRGDNFGLPPQRARKGRFIVRADEKLTAFMELELAVRVPEPHLLLFL